MKARSAVRGKNRKSPVPPAAGHVKEICRTSTGGWLHHVWESAGLFQLSGGVNRIAMGSFGPTPPVSMLRLIRVR